MRKLFLIALVATMVFGFISCSRSITPYEAANGHARCGRWLR
ncbi:MAG TPA: hypothetical protein VK718_01095 [Ferruginibacter sp.]|nr:hypothetical protein [Ferruginibacter sp.]